MPHIFATTLTFALISWFSPYALSATSNVKNANQDRININSKNAITLNYGQNEWNKDATKIDSAALMMREGRSGKIIQIEVEETAPDSAVFSGVYSVSFKDLSSLKAEFYAPDQNLLKDLEGRRQISQLITTKKLKRLPFVLRRDPITGRQFIELFDNIEQARMAYRTFQSEQELLTALKNRIDQRDQTIDTATLALEKAEFAEVSRQRAERVRLMQVESQQLATNLQKFTLASPQARASFIREAKALAEEAMTFFRNQKYPEAQKKFEESIVKDPSNQSFLFQYGVTLYKQGSYNRALVYFDLASKADVSQTEISFYRGLAFYKLHDSTSAIEAFTAVTQTNDTDLAPSARFYIGLIHFERRRWEQARTEFQAVLDTSKDPTLDQRSEAYIEQSLRAQAIEAERKHRWTLMGTIGGSYDNNILLSSQSDRDQGIATDMEGWRTLLQGSAKYRALYDEKNEWAIQLDALTQYSVNKDFAITDSISDTDATIWGITLPWTYKTVVKNTGYKLDIVPGYESTYMSIENHEFKSIYSSYTLGFQNLFILSDTWYTNLNIDLRQDNSGMNLSVGDDDSTALKSRVTWSNINMPFESKRKLVTSEISYTNNAAVGKNNFYNRFDVGVGYISPAFWNTTFSSKLSIYNLNYPNLPTVREDINYGLMLGFNKKLNETLIAGLAATYNINDSTLSSNQYKKLTTLLTLTALRAF